MDISQPLGKVSRLRERDMVLSTGRPGLKARPEPARYYPCSFGKAFFPPLQHGLNVVTLEFEAKK